jgi:hypothetical protein
MFASCKKDKGGQDPEPPEPPETPVDVVMQNTTLSGTVYDTEGNPLSGVRVTTGSLDATTGADGRFTFDRAGTVNSRAVIKFRKDGYFTLTRSGVKADEMTVNAVLRRKGNGNSSSRASFSAGEAKTLSAGGMQAEIPASALVRADGSDYSGNVNADMLYLDPNDPDFDAAMPGGDLAGIRTNNSEAQLLSYGMAEISLADDAGNPLQLKDGTGSQLTFPIPEGMENNPPSAIPLWYFDEQRGVWIEEGVATLQGNVYKGTVSHFSWHNLDVPADRVTVKGKVTDCENNPVSYVKVTVDQTAAVTDSKGGYSVFVPSNTPVTVTVKSRDYSDYSPEVSHSIPGKQGNSVVTQDIVLPCRTQAPGDDATFSVERASITYIMDGETTIITFDNYGKRIRWDMNYGTDNHSVIIFDDMAQLYTIGAGNQWIDMSYEGASAQVLFSVFIYRGDMYGMLPGFVTQPNETIAGKSCTIITYDIDDCYVKLGGWNGLIMLMEDCEGVSLAATNVSLDVPANAFTKTTDIF